MKRKYYPASLFFTLLSSLLLSETSRAEGDSTQVFLLDLDGDKTLDRVSYTQFSGSEAWHQITFQLSSEGNRIRSYQKLIPNYFIRGACETGDTLISTKRTPKKDVVHLLTHVGDLDRSLCGALEEQKITIGYIGYELRVTALSERKARAKTADEGYDSRKEASLGASCPPPTLESVERHGLPACLKLGLFEK